MQRDGATITRDLSDTCGALVVGVGDGDGASVVRISLQAAARVELGLSVKMKRGPLIVWPDCALPATPELSPKD